MERFIGGVFIDKILRFAQDDNLKGVQYPLGAYLSQGGAEPRPCARKSLVFQQLAGFFVIAAGHHDHWPGTAHAGAGKYPFFPQSPYGVIQFQYVDPADFTVNGFGSWAGYCFFREVAGVSWLVIHPYFLA